MTPAPVYDKEDLRFARILHELVASLGEGALEQFLLYLETGKMAGPYTGELLAYCRQYGLVEKQNRERYRELFEFLASS